MPPAEEELSDRFGLGFRSLRELADADLLLDPALAARGVVEALDGPERARGLPRHGGKIAERMSSCRGEIWPD